MSVVERCGAGCSWRACAGRWGANGLPAGQGQQDRQRPAAVVAHEARRLRRGAHVGASVVGPQGRLALCRRHEQFAHRGQGLLAAAVGQQAVVPYSVEAAGQHMQQEAMGAGSVKTTW